MDEEDLEKLAQDMAVVKTRLERLQADLDRYIEADAKYHEQIQLDMKERRQFAVRTAFTAVSALVTFIGLCITILVFVKTGQ